MACVAKDSIDLEESTRTNFYGGSTTTDWTTESDLSSDISSTQDNMTGCLSDLMFRGLIGRGKFSQVYAAHHVPSNLAVAVKKDNELIIVLEWGEAGDLGRIIKSRRDTNLPFTITEVLYYFQQVCAALKHMHDRRMMHRDLKPTNIFVTAMNVLKLGDLGLSRYFSSKTLQAESLVGTPYYMSPEAIRGSPYNFSSDIWSLGCLLYELITLRNPFYREGLNFYLLGKSICSCHYEQLPSSVPQQLRSLVTAMLQPDPSSRPTAGQALLYVTALAEGRWNAQLHQPGRCDEGDA